MTGTNLVLYDGNCGMCRRMANWSRRHDAYQRLTFVPSQEGPPEIMTPEMLETCETSVQVVTSDGVTIGGGRAVLFVLGQLGWKRFERFFTHRALIGIVEAVYKVVATNRVFFSKLLFVGEHDEKKERPTKGRS
jgi:predicted DCC family thiol-disulfide oxidoreductase YuxK